MKIRKIYAALFYVLLVSCGEGYEKIDGNWAWVLRSEAGKHIREINPDKSTFKILNDKEYADMQIEKVETFKKQNVALPMLNNTNGQTTGTSFQTGTTR